MLTVWRKEGVKFICCAEIKDSVYEKRQEQKTALLAMHCRIPHT